MDALPTARECFLSVGNRSRLNSLVQPLQGPTGMVRGVIAAGTISSHPVVSDDPILALQPSVLNTIRSGPCCVLPRGPPIADGTSIHRVCRQFSFRYHRARARRILWWGACLLACFISVYSNHGNRPSLSKSSRIGTTSLRVLAMSSLMTSIVLRMQSQNQAR